MKARSHFSTAGAILLLLFSSLAGAREQWTKQEANVWYEKQPWLLGANYTTSTAVNQIEMWHKDTFDLATTEKELGIASS